MKKLFLILITCLGINLAHAAYLRNIPMTLTQPDGSVLHCFASGDEFFNYLHDANGYTIIQHPQTGYWVYAEKREGKLVATNYIAGVYDPASKGLEPYAIISSEEWIARRAAWETPDPRPKNHDYIPNHGTLNNISIFIRFSDDPELTNTYSSIDNMFNDVSEGAISMRSYFRAASYGAIEIPTTFYPGHKDEVIISYQDTQPRSYFEPYNESTNPNGYQDDERAEREFSLLERAVKYVNAYYPIPSDLNIDYDNDGLVDNVCFIVKGGVGAWNSLLWPHKWALQDRTVRVNGKRVWTFNFQLADASSYFNTSTMCHEMNHSLGAPDLYHYYHGDNLSPVGSWDLMENNATPPQHCGAYMKMKYGHWIDEIPVITQAGIYTLNPIGSTTPTNIAYKIPSDDPDQFYVLEYRDKTSTFETALPGSGLLVYRIDTRFSGNAGYDPDNGIYDEVYLFRPGGSISENGSLSIAHLSSDVNRTEFNSSTVAYPFYTDGTIDYNLNIYNITSAGNTISFSYGSSSDCEAPSELTATVDGNNVTLSWNAANNAQSYNIYRCGTLIDNTNGTSYVDNNVTYGIYTYYLKSVDANGLYSTSSETITVTLLPKDFDYIGNGSSMTSNTLPSYSYYKYALTQQIYTAQELGQTGYITCIAFYNDGAEKTRTYDIYMKHTTKNTFSGASDWEVVSSNDKVFSGTVTMAAEDWTFITLDRPFDYDGSSNLVLVSDDNSANWTGQPHMSCRVFHAPSQSLQIYSDNTNYDPTAPKDLAGTVMTVKNQLLFSKTEPITAPITITVSSNSVQGGTVRGGGEYNFGDICTVTATVNLGYHFSGWTENEQVVSTDTVYSFGVVQDRNLVAVFEKGITVGNEGEATSQYLPSYSFYNHSLTQQIYTADEIGTPCTINSIAFYNGETTKTRSYDMYLVHTDKAVFNSAKDWITVAEADKVFSGSVEMVTGVWTVFSLDIPFEYDGTSNLALIMDDNTGSYSSGMKCRVYNAQGNQTLRIYSDGTDYDPFNPTTYQGTLMTVKNQIILGVETSSTQTVALAAGWNWFVPTINITLEELEAGLGSNGISILSQNSGSVIYDDEDDEWTGSLTELIPGEMYIIQVNGNIDFSLSGNPVTNASVTINKGYNWFGYTGNEITIIQALSGFEAADGDCIMAFGEEGSTSYDGEDEEWTGHLSSLKPGHGYIYYSNSETPKTLVFPSK
jgi:M6 family metalloprotease-like protein